MNIPQLNIGQLHEFLQLIAIDRNYPVLIKGPPGIGKSQIGDQLCIANKATQIDIRLNLHDSVDFRGVPDLIEVQIKRGGKVVETKKMTTWAMADFLPFEGNPRFADDELIIITWDEIGSASQAVFPVAMQAINERRIGTNVFKSGVRQIAMTNRVSDRGTSSYLPSTLNNRFIIVEAVPDQRAWCDWWIAVKKGTPLAVAFYDFHKAKNYFFNFDPTADDFREKDAFATPRSNEKAWTLVMDDKLPDFVRRAAVIGSVGSVGLEIISFIEVYNQVLKPRQILADPKGVALPTEESFLYATAASVSGAMDTKTADKFDIFLQRLPPLYQALAWTLALRRTDGTAEDLAHTDAGFRYTKRMAQSIF